MKQIKMTITELGRNTLKEAPAVFNEERKYFNTVEDVREYLTERYGKMPGMKNKVYQDAPDGEPMTVGFIHSYWNRDISHNSDAWYQTDWVCFSNVEYKPFDIQTLKH